MYFTLFYKVDKKMNKILKKALGLNNKMAFWIMLKEYDNYLTCKNAVQFFSANVTSIASFRLGGRPDVLSCCLPVHVRYFDAIHYLSLIYIIVGFFFLFPFFFFFFWTWESQGAMP